MKTTYLSPVVSLAFTLSFAGYDMTAQPQGLENTIAHYSYDVVEEQRAFLPDGLPRDSVPFIEVEKLTPQSATYSETIGVDATGYPYYSRTYTQQTKVEDWMNPSYRAVSTPDYLRGWDINGELLYDEPVDSATQSSNEEMRDWYDEVGFTPCLTLFPTLNSPYVEASINAGALLQEHTDGSFTLQYPSGEDETIDPGKLKITRSFYLENTEYTVEKYYLPMAPYGFVLDGEVEWSQAAETPMAVVHMTMRKFSNHQLVDPLQKVPETADFTHIEIYPVPLNDAYTLNMIGLPDEEVNAVYVYDHLGTQVAAHVSVSGQRLELNGSEYPSGTLIVQAITNRGNYSTLVTKP